MKQCIVKIIQVNDSPYNLTHAIFNINADTLSKIKLVQKMVNENRNLLNYDCLSAETFLFSGVRILAPTSMLNVIDNNNLDEEQVNELDLLTYNFVEELPMDYDTKPAEFVRVNVYENYISLEGMFKHYEDVFEFEQDITTEELEGMV